MGCLFLKFEINFNQLSKQLVKVNFFCAFTYQLIDKTK